MLRALFLSASAARWTAAAVVLTLACQTANAQVMPWKIRGEGSVPAGMSVVGNDSPYRATGNATILGNYSDGGVFNVLSLNPATGHGTFHAVTTFVAANGDVLAGTFGNIDNGAAAVGEFQLYDAGGGKFYAVFIAELNPVPALSTGRFRDVINGSLIMVAVTEPFVPVIDMHGFTPPFDYSWEGDGWLEFRRR